VGYADRMAVMVSLTLRTGIATDDADC
jgi:hypothetical protein